MKNQTNRRCFLKSAALGVSAIGGATALSGCKTLNFGGGKLFDISLAQWSLNRQFFGRKIDAKFFLVAYLYATFGRLADNFVVNVVNTYRYGTVRD